MVRAIPLAALLFLAGCFGPAATSDDAPVEQGLDMSFFESCPLDREYVVPCEANATTPFYVDVADSWPSNWMCITFADQRFQDDISGTYYPYPDWYTLFGPAISDGAGGVEFQMGIAYNSHNDTERVGGAIRLFNEGREELFTFEGPARGFVRIPVEITGPDLSYIGVLYPATLGTLSEQYAYRDDFPDPKVITPRNFLNVTGLDAKRIESFWSLGPYRGNISSGVDYQFDLARNVDADGKEYHFPAHTDGAAGITYPRGGQGSSWGLVRGYPYNTSVRHGDVVVEGSLQPYMVFGAQWDDVYNPLYTAIVHWQCGCYGIPVTSVEGVFCAVGVPPPVVTREAATIRFEMAGLAGIGPAGLPSLPSGPSFDSAASADPIQAPAW